MLYVPTHSKKLLSIGMIADKKNIGIFDFKKCLVINNGDPNMPTYHERFPKCVTSNNKRSTYMSYDERNEYPPRKSSDGKSSDGRSEFFQKCEVSP
jgi:hypothetical protein